MEISRCYKKEHAPTLDYLPVYTPVPAASSWPPSYGPQWFAYSYVSRQTQTRDANAASWTWRSSRAAFHPGHVAKPPLLFPGLTCKRPSPGFPEPLLAGEVDLPWLPGLGTPGTSERRSGQERAEGKGVKLNTAEEQGFPASQSFDLAAKVLQPQPTLRAPLRRRFGPISAKYGDGVPPFTSQFTSFKHFTPCSERYVYYRPIVCSVYCYYGRDPS
ncbi:hypothetical protein F4678DRAFT_125729 [Xylaria arbuscula]|nr:hypothetical protein F4678DRAFT_125729 [Xylaria arbuscula]